MFFISTALSVKYVHTVVLCCVGSGSNVASRNLIQHKAQRTCGLGHQIPLTFSNYCGLLISNPLVAVSHFISLSLSLEQYKDAQHSDPKPRHTGNRNGVSLVDDPWFESQQRQEIFFVLQIAQIRSEAHSHYYSIGTGVLTRG
jgi:hypothetical protein